jgi:hypothetical protein
VACYVRKGALHILHTGLAKVGDYWCRHACYCMGCLHLVVSGTFLTKQGGGRRLLAVGCMVGLCPGTIFGMTQRHVPMSSHGLMLTT